MVSVRKNNWYHEFDSQQIIVLRVTTIMTEVEWTESQSIC